MTGDRIPPDRGSSDVQLSSSDVRLSDTDLSDELESSVSAVTARLRGGPAAGDALESIAAAVTASGNLERALDRIVQLARSEGHTWQEIGQILSISRQAAQQRFGERQPDLATAERDALRRRAREILEQLAAGDWEKVTADWTEVMHAELGIERLKEAWRQIISTAGPLQAIHGGAVTAKGPFRIVDVPVSFQHGPMKGRVVFTRDDQVAGLFVLLPDAP